jgi:hypothetical protein
MRVYRCTGGGKACCSVVHCLFSKWHRSTKFDLCDTRLSPHFANVFVLYQNLKRNLGVIQRCSRHSKGKQTLNYPVNNFTEAWGCGCDSAEQVSRMPSETSGSVWILSSVEYVVVEAGVQCVPARCGTRVPLPAEMGFTLRYHLQTGAVLSRTSRRHNVVSS